MACAVCGGSSTPEVRLVAPERLLGLPACRACADPIQQLTEGSLSEAEYTRYSQYLDANSTSRIQNEIQALWEAARQSSQPGAARLAEELDTILVSTTDSLDGYRIYNYLGLISEVATTEVGTQFLPSQATLRADVSELKKVAMIRARTAARAVHANAIIGITMAYFNLTPTVFAVSITGSAVIAEPSDS